MVTRQNYVSTSKDDEQKAKVPKFKSTYDCFLSYLWETRCHLASLIRQHLMPRRKKYFNKIVGLDPANHGFGSSEANLTAFSVSIKILSIGNVQLVTVNKSL